MFPVTPLGKTAWPKPVQVQPNDAKDQTAFQAAAPNGVAQQNDIGAQAVAPAAPPSVLQMEIRAMLDPQAVPETDVNDTAADAKDAPD